MRRADNVKAEICPKCGVRQLGVNPRKIVKTNEFTGNPGEHKCLMAY